MFPAFLARLCRLLFKGCRKRVAGWVGWSGGLRAGLGLAQEGSPRVAARARRRRCNGPEWGPRLEFRCLTMVSNHHQTVRGPKRGRARPQGGSQQLGLNVSAQVHRVASWLKMVYPLHLPGRSPYQWLQLPDGNATFQINCLHVPACIADSSLNRQISDAVEYSTGI